MTIIPRNGRFGVKVWNPGTKGCDWIGTFDTEAEAKYAERGANMAPGREVPSIKDWGRTWLSDYAREAPATRLVYRQAVKRITADLGALKLSAIDRPTARRYANEWPRNVVNVARTMWGDARNDGVCPENPWAGLKLKQSRGRRDIQALTEDQIDELANIAQRVHRDYGTEARAIVLTLAYVALRPGELCALKWSDLDLHEREIHVRRSLDVTGAEKLPKNGKTRTVTIPPPALYALQTVPHTVTDDYVFHTVQGRRLNKSNLWYLWKPIATAWEATGHLHIDLYELRHAAATILLERGLPHSDVAVQLGHEDGGALVQERYGHPSKDRSRDRLKMAFAGDETPTRRERVRRTDAA